MKLVSLAAALLSFALLSIAHAAISEGVALNYFQQGNDQYKLGNIAAAIADYTEAIQFEPGVAILYSARGGARHALGEYQSALTDFTIAIQLSPRWASLYEGRAAVQISLENYDDAIADLTEAVTMSPKYAQGYRLRGSAKEFKGDLAGAIVDYTEAARLNVHNPYPHILLWIIRTRLGQIAVANQELAAYVDRHVEKSTDHWGTKVGEFILSRINESEFFGARSSYFSDTARGHQCEAWFYAGLKHLLAGDKNIAVKDFRKCLATNARNYDEYVRAVIELKKLGNA